MRSVGEKRTHGILVQTEWVVIVSDRAFRHHVTLEFLESRHHGLFKRLYYLKGLFFRVVENTRDR